MKRTVTLSLVPLISDNDGMTSSECISDSSDSVLAACMVTRLVYISKMRETRAEDPPQPTSHLEQQCPISRKPITTARNNWEMPMWWMPLRTPKASMKYSETMVPGRTIVQCHGECDQRIHLDRRVSY